VLFSFILAIIIGLVPQAIALDDKKSDRPSMEIALTTKRAIALKIRIDKQYVICYN
jgi:hypothetical protein